MTPMLDIVFIMLIFSIVTTSFVKENAVDWLSLKGESPIQPRVAPLVVTIDEVGTVSLQGRTIELESLIANVEMIRTKQDFSGAVIRSHHQVSTGTLVKAVDLIKLAGINQVSVAKL